MLIICKFHLKISLEQEKENSDLLMAKPRTSGTVAQEKSFLVFWVHWKMSLSPSTTA